jgi:hypothetical protein
MRGNFVIRGGNSFDFLVIRGHPAPHKPIGGGQPIEHVDFHNHLLLL